MRHGSKIEVHPTSEIETERRPDFLVALPSGPRFYLEAIVATGKSTAKSATEARLNDFYQTIEKLDSPDFFIRIQAYNFNPSTPISGSQLRREVQRWLSTLDYEQVRKAIELQLPRPFPEITFFHEGEPITFVAIPKGQTRGKPGIRPLAGFPFRFHYGDASIRPIRDAIIKKSSRYGRLNLPYLVGVDVLDFTASSESAESALFGTQNNSEAMTLSKRACTKSDHGVWTSEKGPAHTRVSGALVVRRLFPWALSPTEVCLYHNPWAGLQVPSGFPMVRQAALNEDGPQYRGGCAHPRTPGIARGLAWEGPITMINPPLQLACDPTPVHSFRVGYLLSCSRGSNPGTRSCCAPRIRIWSAPGGNASDGSEAPSRCQALFRSPCNSDVRGRGVRRRGCAGPGSPSRGGASCIRLRALAKARRRALPSRLSVSSMCSKSVKKPKHCWR